MSERHRQSRHIDVRAMLLGVSQAMILDPLRPIQVMTQI